MTWDNDRAFRRVDPLDVPPALLQILEDHAGESLTVSLQVEQAKRTASGKRALPTVGNYLPEAGEPPIDIACAVAGMALAVVEASGDKCTGRCRVRVKTSDNKRPGKDFHVREIGHRFEGEDEHSSGAGENIVECRGCAALETVVTTLQMENSSLREMLTTTIEHGNDRFDAIMQSANARFDTLMERSEARIDAERSRRDAAVDKQSSMAEKVLDPSNDATARTLGMLDKGIELAVAAIDQHQMMAQATAEDRRSQQRHELAGQVISGLEQLAGPIIAAKMGLDPKQVQQAMTTTLSGSGSTEINPYEALVHARNEMFELATDEDWQTARACIGNEPVDAILALRDQDPLLVASALEAQKMIDSAGKMKLINLARMLPAELLSHLLLLNELAQEATQP